MNIADTVYKLSDHQILEMVEVMLDDDHCPRDNIDVYLAAYDEAMHRPSVKTILDLCDHYRRNSQCGCNDC